MADSHHTEDSAVEQATPLWQPSAEAVANSQMTAFTQFVERHTGLGPLDYNQLHNWSVSNPGTFWQLYAEFAGIDFSTPAKATVQNLDKFPGAQWFPGAKLNFAEQLLRTRSDKPALISILENGERASVSYETLFSEVTRTATWLRSLTEPIKAGDRIAGWLPNIPATVSAALAASAVGGVWSSCSPDFGIEGALDRFGQIEPSVLFTCDGYYYAGKTINIVDKVRNVVAQTPSIKRVVWVNVLGEATPDNDQFERLPNEVYWSEVLDTQPPETFEFEQLPFDHPLYILYSSGTTGKPKCIVHGQGGTLIQHRKEQQLHLDLRAEDVLFFFTTCGWMMWNWLISALTSGCTIVLYDGSPFAPTEEIMFDICDAQDVTVFGISAKFLGTAQKAGVRPRQSHKLTSLRMLISTGSPLTEEGFDYVYQDIKPDCHLVSMSGGTDLVSCFMLGNPNLPVYSGQLQCPGLGMAVEIWNDAGQPVLGEQGELVCTRAFPCAPVGFWNDPDNKRYKDAYFADYPNVWVHGDYALQTEQSGYVIYGRSDAVLNPGGVRIGTAEIYRQVEQFDEVVDAVCVGQSWDNDVRVVLFVVLREGETLDDDLEAAIKLHIRQHASPRHTPAKVIQVQDIPRTMSGKIAELAVRDVIHGRPVKNTSALANPEALGLFENIAALQD